MDDQPCVADAGGHAEQHAGRAEQHPSPMRTRAALRAGKPVAVMIPNWLARRSTASRSSSPDHPRRGRDEEEAHREEDHAEIRRAFCRCQRLRAHRLNGQAEVGRRAATEGALETLGGRFQRHSFRRHERDGRQAAVSPAGSPPSWSTARAREHCPATGTPSARCGIASSRPRPPGVISFAVYCKGWVPVRHGGSVGNPLELRHEPLVQRRAFHRHNAAHLGRQWCNRIAHSRAEGVRRPCVQEYVPVAERRRRAAADHRKRPGRGRARIQSRNEAIVDCAPVNLGVHVPRASAQ